MKWHFISDSLISHNNVNTAQKMETADLATLTEEIFNGKLHLFVQCKIVQMIGSRKVIHKIYVSTHYVDDQTVSSYLACLSMRTTFTESQRGFYSLEHTNNVYMLHSSSTQIKKRKI